MCQNAPFSFVEINYFASFLSFFSVYLSFSAYLCVLSERLLYGDIKMKSLHSDIEITGTPEQVWTHLTDFGRFPEWNPLIQHATGAVEQGATIEAQLVLPNGSKLAAKPTLIKVEPNRELRWLGRLGFKGLFDAEHYFEIEPLNDNRVRLRHGEYFRGLLVTPLLALNGKNILAGFVAMNEALKAEVERVNGE